MADILFVCSANQIRSPLAQAILHKLLDQTGYDQWRVESAGTWAFDGAPAHRLAIHAAKIYKLDLSKHHARTISLILLQEFDLVFVMDHFQLEAINFEFPSQAGKVHLLSELVGENFDIRDPVAGTIQNMDETAALINEILHEGFAQLVQMVDEVTG